MNNDNGVIAEGQNSLVIFKGMTSSDAALVRAIWDNLCFMDFERLYG